MEDNRLINILKEHGIRLKSNDGSFRNVIDVLEDLYLKVSPREFSSIFKKIEQADMEKTATVFDSAREREYSYGIYTAPTRTTNNLNLDKPTIDDSMFGQDLLGSYHINLEDNISTFNINIPSGDLSFPSDYGLYRDTELLSPTQEPPEIKVLKVRSKILFYYWNNQQLNYAIYEDDKPIEFKTTDDFLEVLNNLGVFE